VTENGLAWQENTVAEAVNDTMRQQYLHDHIDAVGQALQAGCDVRGYFVWSFQVGLDCHGSKYIQPTVGKATHVDNSACVQGYLFSV
jgi:beta-glucosidase/6-phospho-beta-glucosidase/beta-galactosidase